MTEYIGASTLLPSSSSNRAFRDSEEAPTSNRISAGRVVKKEVVFPQQNYRPDNYSTRLQRLSQLQSTLCQSLRELSTSLDVRRVQDQRIQSHIVDADNFQPPLPFWQRIKQEVDTWVPPHALQICFEFPPDLRVDEVMDII